MNIKERQRVFLALPLSKDIQHGIQRFRHQHTHLERSGFRWIPAENLHITLFFLGDILLRETGPVCDHIRAIMVESPSMELTFKTFSVQPRKNPRMIWAQFHAHDCFADLSSRLANACQPFLLKPQQKHKKPIPHVTIARIKGFTKELAVNNELELPKLSVRCAELWLSEFGAGRTTYTPLATFDLLVG